jgi:hypothetical protein
MENRSIDETVITRYLLGDLPEDVQVQVEDRAFTDQEYLRVVEAVEADLIDAYIRGELQPSQRRQFESRFLVSAERRKKVEFARALAQVTAEAKAASAPAQSGGAAQRSWLARLFRGPMPAFSFATVAVAVVLIVVVSWQTVWTARLRSRIDQLEAARNRQEQQEAALQNAVKAERARADDLSVQLQHGGPPAFASLVLMPGAIRGTNSDPRLLLPHGAQLAVLHIQLEPRDEYPQYRAELRTQRGGEILTRSRLREQHSGAGRFVVLEIPAGILNPGEYELTLQGVAASGRSQDIDYYRFSVQKK